MADDVLIEQDPQLDGVLDKQSRRNLLESPDPLVVTPPASKPTRVVLEIKNGQEGLIDLAISSDEPWLCPETSRMTLVGGESGDCALSIAPGGEAEYANLLLSWEGIEQTRCGSVMILRKIPGASASSSPPPSAKASGAVNALVEFIENRGTSRGTFIDTESEYRIFRHGGSLELSPHQTESVLNRYCSKRGCTRQTRLTDRLETMLRDTATRNGAIDQKTYDGAVELAARRLMPRSDAEEHCLELIVNNAWKTKGRWFPKKRKEFRL